MKTSIISIILILTATLASGYFQSSQDKKAEKSPNHIATETLTTKKAPEDRPRILFLLSKDKGRQPSLWWANTVKAGC